MHGVIATAPAKLVVAGEYAVVHGSPAISAAVGVRASATVTRGGDSWSLHIANTSATCEFTPVGVSGSIEWQTDPGAYGALLAAAWRVLSRQQALGELSPHAVQLDSRPFFAADGAKRGLGSSAAVAVALTAALQTALGVTPDAASCLAVHCEFQAQRGSGIDVCTSFHGGVVAKVDEAIESVAWPETLVAAAVWTGVPASTKALLGRMEAFAAAHPDAFQQVCATLHAAAVDALGQWRTAPVQQILDALYEFAVQLRRFDEQCDIGVWSAEHVQLERLAEDFGLVYKPSGAGGGDYGLAFGADPERLEDFRMAVTDRGFSAPDFDLGAAGLRVMPVTTG